MTIPGIAGEGPHGKIVCRSFQVGRIAPWDAATGQASGGHIGGVVHITKQSYRSSPALMQALATGQVFSSVVFEFVRVHTDAKGVEQTTTTKTTKVTRAIISSFRQIGSGDGPQGEVTFTYETAEGL